MISSGTIKGIIKSNEEFILNTVQEIVKRENILFPTALRKVNIIYGVLPFWKWISRRDSMAIE